jgi:hypothetical protein
MEQRLPGAGRHGVGRNKSWMAAFVLAVSTGCAWGQWDSKPAERPLSRRELASRAVTVVGEGEFAEALAQAMVHEGFNVVPHPPYHQELEVTLVTTGAQDGSLAVATMRSDGFFVDEAKAPAAGDRTAAELARTLAVSQGMADFVRNGGTPQQANFSPD